jgi:hypothetical protein
MPFIVDFRTIAPGDHPPDVEAIRSAGNANSIDLTVLLQHDRMLLVTPEGAGSVITERHSVLLGPFITARAQARPVSVLRAETAMAAPSPTARARAERLLAFTRQAKVFSGTSGNLSVRATDDGAFLVSPTGMQKAQLRQQDMVLVHGDASGTSFRYSGERKPSIDTPVQGAVYRRFPHIAAMLHLHADGCGVVDAIPTTFPYPCGTAEEVNEVIGALERFGLKEGHGGFCVEFIHHGYLIGFTKSQLRSLGKGWANIEANIRFWTGSETGGARPVFQRGRLISFVD